MSKIAVEPKAGKAEGSEGVSYSIMYSMGAGTMAAWMKERWAVILNYHNDHEDGKNIHLVNIAG